MQDVANREIREQARVSLFRSKTQSSERGFQGQEELTRRTRQKSLRSASEIRITEAAAANRRDVVSIG